MSLSQFHHREKSSILATPSSGSLEDKMPRCSPAQFHHSADKAVCDSGWAKQRNIMHNKANESGTKYSGKEGLTNEQQQAVETLMWTKYIYVRFMINTKHKMEC